MVGQNLGVEIRGAGRRGAAFRVPVPERAYRPELNGLRGVALSLVVAFHLFGQGRVSGGIDVFLAITGFLFTGSLLRAAVGGSFRPWEHYARIGQRIIPPVVLVSAVTLGLGLVLLPQSRWIQLLREFRASVLYFENWELIGSQLTYDAAGPGTSPFQHIWSLSIQGQFHLVWPLVLLGTVWLARRLRLDPGALVLVVLGAVFAASFGYAIAGVAANQTVAYFDTFARLWQFALGGIGAVLLPLLRIGLAVRLVLGWLGLGMLVSVGFVLDAAHTFPGVGALYPVTAMLLVLAAGTTGDARAADAWLTAAPVRWLADISYSLYLWHWPLIIFASVAVGRGLGLVESLAVLVASVALAWLTRRFLEDPSVVWRERVGARATVLVLAVTLGVFGAGSTAGIWWLEAARAQALEDAQAEWGGGGSGGAGSGAGGEPGGGSGEPGGDGGSGGSEGDDGSGGWGSAAHPGAGAIVPGTPIAASTARFHPADAIPHAAAVSEDKPAIYSRGCVQGHEDSPDQSSVLICPDLQPGDGPLVVMAGGSHVLQWWPAMVEIARRNNWELVVVDKDGCQLTADRGGNLGNPQTTACEQWNDEALGVLADLRPDALFTLATTTRGDVETMPEGFLEVWRQLGAEGIPVVAIRDTARLAAPAPDCLLSRGGSAVSCGQARTAVLSETFPPAVSGAFATAGGISLPAAGAAPLPAPILAAAPSSLIAGTSLPAAGASLPSNVTLVDMAAGFCDELWCPAVIGNVIVYRDASHISVTYMRTLVPMLEAQLMASAPWLF